MDSLKGANMDTTHEHKTDVVGSNHVIDTSDASDTKETADKVESSSSSQDLGYDEKHTAKLIRKIDWRLLPFLALLYLLSFLDRSTSFCAV